MTRAHRWTILAAIAALLLCAAAGCGSPSAARRLALAEDTIDTNPDSALAILRSIPASSLRGEQRALHALLSVKATDRAFLPHRSDSAAAIALDYYGDRPGGLRTAEAHYYAGRVAYDMADYPRALKAFHLALRSIEETPDNSTRALKLKSAIVSQQGQLLTDVCLHNEARPFYREAIKSDSILGDTLNLFYDLRELAFTYIKEHEYDSARIILNRALPVCHGIVPEADTELYSLLALSYLKDRQYDRAAEFVDSIDPYVNPGHNSLTLSVLARIYENTARMDSAVHFARILQRIPYYTTNKFTGRRILARNSLRSGDIDTIAAYHDSLAEYAVKMSDMHALELNLPGTMFYRLMTTELDNSRLQTRNDTLALSVYALALLVAACIIIILVALYRHTYRRKKEEEAMTQIQHVILLLPAPEETAPTVEDVIPVEATAPSTADKALPAATEPAPTPGVEATPAPIPAPRHEIPSSGANPREKLVDALLRRMEALAAQPYHLPASLRDSAAVVQLRAMIAGNTALSPDSPLWSQLEEAVRLVSPDFKPSIHLLLGKPSLNDYHTALLIKAGFTPTEISTLMCRSKGTISSNRQRMCERIFKQKLSNTLFDSLIRSL